MIRTLAGEQSHKDGGHRHTGKYGRKAGVPRPPATYYNKSRRGGQASRQSQPQGDNSRGCQHHYCGMRAACSTTAAQGKRKCQSDLGCKSKKEVQTPGSSKPVAAASQSNQTTNPCFSGEAPLLNDSRRKSRHMLHPWRAELSDALARMMRAALVGLWPGLGLIDTGRQQW